MRSKIIDGIITLKTEKEIHFEHQVRTLARLEACRKTLNFAEFQNVIVSTSITTELLQMSSPSLKKQK
jgi:hypothetical protein